MYTYVVTPGIMHRKPDPDIVKLLHEPSDARLVSTVDDVLGKREADGLAYRLSIKCTLYMQMCKYQKQWYHRSSIGRRPPRRSIPKADYPIPYTLPYPTHVQVLCFEVHPIYADVQVPTTLY